MAYLKMNFVSACLSRSVSVSLLLPSGKVEELSTIANEGYKKGAPMKVIYLLGGVMEDESGWCINSRLPSYAEEHDYLIVMPNGEGKGYINQGKDRFYDFISKELPSFIESRFYVGSKKEDRIIAGLSMGGFGALVHAFSKPDFWGYAGAFSPLLCDSVWGDKKTHPLSLAIKAEKERMPLPKVFHAIGEDDFFHEDNLRFLNKTKGFKMLDINSQIIPGFGHEWAFWDREIKEFLDWLDEERNG